MIKKNNKIMDNSQFTTHNSPLKKGATLSLSKGYKNTEIGVIPEEWEVKTMNDICWVNQGLQIPIEQRYNQPIKNSKVYITIQYLGNGKKAEYILDYSKSVCCDKEDILMTRTGNTGIVVTNVQGVFHNNFFKINFDKKQVSREYLLYFLRDANTQKTILEKAGTSTIPDLNHNDFYSIKIGVPTSIKEQTAIATVLSDTDALIQALEKKIAKKQLIKKGAMQTLLSPKQGWVVKTLGEVAEMSSGGTPSSKVSEYYGGDVIWVSISDISDAGKFISNSEKKLTKKGLLNSSAKVFPSNIILLAMYASIGKCCITTKPVSTSQAILGIIVKTQLLQEYLYYFLIHNKENISRQGQQGTQSNLNKGMVENIKIHLPPLQEQTRIAQILSDMDAEIEILQKKLAKYKLLKQGLMQVLLTGKIRLQRTDAMHCVCTSN